MSYQVRLGTWLAQVFASSAHFLRRREGSACSGDVRESSSEQNWIPFLTNARQVGGHILLGSQVLDSIELREPGNLDLLIRTLLAKCIKRPLGEVAQ